MKDVMYRYVFTIQYGKGWTHTLNGPTGQEYPDDSMAFQAAHRIAADRFPHWLKLREAHKKRHAFPTIRVMKVMAEITPILVEKFTRKSKDAGTRS